MNREKILKELYYYLWLSEDFECDLEANFPSQIANLKWNENQISDNDLMEMYTFLNQHPLFN